MRRISILEALGVVGIAIIGTLFLVPSSGWHVKIDSRVAFGKLRPEGHVMYIEFFEAIDLLRPYYQGEQKKPEDAIVKALCIRDPMERRRALVAVADRFPEDKLCQAMLCRYNLDFSQPIESPDYIPDRETHDRYQAQLEAAKKLEAQFLRKGVERGEQLEPENAFFPIALATLAMRENNSQELTSALDRAERCTRFIEYGEAESKLLIDALKRHRYDGATTIYTTRLGLIHVLLSDLRRLSEWINEIPNHREQVRRRIQLLKILSIARNSTNSTMTLVSASYYSRYLVLPEPSWSMRDPTSKAIRERNSKIKPVQWVTIAQALQKEATTLGVNIKGFDVGADVRASQQLAVAHRLFSPRYPDKSPPTPYEKTPIAATWMVGIVVFIAVTSLFMLGQWVRANQAIALSLSLLPALVYAYIQPHDPWTVLMMIYLAVAICFAWHGRLRKWIPWIVGAAVLVGLMSRVITIFSMPGVSPFAWIVAGLAAVGYCLSLIRENVWLSWIFGLLQVIVLIAFTTWAYRLGYTHLTAQLLFVAVALGPVAKIPVWRLWGPGLLVGALGLSLVIRDQMDLDTKFARAIPDKDYSVDVMRRNASTVSLEK